MSVAELDTAPEALEATLNYYLDTGNTPVSLVAGPGGVDTRIGGGGHDPHVVTLQNGRLHLREFDIDAPALSLSSTRPRSAISTTRTRCAGSTTPR